MSEEPDWNKLTVVQLKEELTKKGLDTAGKKADLVERLTLSSQAEKSQSPAKGDKEKKREEKVPIKEEVMTNNDKSETSNEATEDNSEIKTESKETEESSAPEEKEDALDTIGDDADHVIDADEEMITLDKVGDDGLEEDSDTENKAEDGQSWKRKPRKSGESSVKETKGIDKEKEDKVTKDKTEGEDRIKYIFKGVDKLFFDRIMQETRSSKQVSMFPLTMADLGRSEILECLDRCSSFNVNFVNESTKLTPGNAWKGLLKMDFKTQQDALNAKDALPKMGEHFSIVHKSNKASTKEWYGDKKPAASPKFEQMIFIGRLPDDIDEYKIQEEFPDANLVIMPYKEDQKQGMVYVNFPDIASMVKAVTDHNQSLTFGDKVCKIEVVRQKGVPFSVEFRKALFGDQAAPVTKTDEQYEGMLRKPALIKINSELRALGSRFQYMRNKRAPAAVLLKRKMDSLLRKLQIHQAVRRKMFRDKMVAKHAVKESKDKAQGEKVSKVKEVKVTEDGKKDSKDTKDSSDVGSAKKVLSQDRKEIRRSHERRSSGQSRMSPRKHESPRHYTTSPRGRGRGQGMPRGRSVGHFQGRGGPSHPPLMDRRGRDDRKRVSNWDSRDMGPQGAPGIMGAAPTSLADLISQVGSGGASVTQLLNFMQEHQVHGGDAGMASLQASIQQQLGAFGGSSGGQYQGGIQGSHTGGHSRQSGSGRGSRFGGRSSFDRLGPPPQGSDERRFHSDRRARSPSPPRERRSDVRKVEEGGDSQTVNLLMQLSTMLGSHLEKQEQQMQEIRGQVQKVAEPRGRGGDKLRSERSPPSATRDRHHGSHSQDSDSHTYQPTGKKPRIDMGGNDRGFSAAQDRGFNSQNQSFGQQGRGFNQQEKGFGQQDRNFPQQDRSYGQQDRGFNQQDRGFNQQDRGFNQQERGFSQQDRGFNQQDRGFSQQDRGFNQQDRGFTSQDRGFDQQGRGGYDSDKRGSSGIGSMRSIAGIGSSSSSSGVLPQRSMAASGHTSQLGQYDNYRRDNSNPFTSGDDLTSGYRAGASQTSGSSFFGNKQSNSGGFQHRGGFR